MRSAVQVRARLWITSFVGSLLTVGCIASGFPEPDADDETTGSGGAAGETAFAGKARRPQSGGASNDTPRNGEGGESESGEGGMGGQLWIDSNRAAHVVSAGEFHTCAIAEDGSTFCWGNNMYGQIGDGDRSQYPRFSPSRVASLEGAVELAAGWTHTCALLGDGTVSCWGSDTEGQLGNGPHDTATHHEAASVPDLTRVTQVDVGENFSCALRKDGSIWCWGLDTSGQIGESVDPTSTKPAPARVELELEAVHLACGGRHACAVLEDDSVACWGWDDWGQIGDGEDLETEPPVLKYTPVSVLGLSNVAKVAAGYNHSCALLRDETVWCWGYDGWGQLGDGSDDGSDEHVPVPVVNLSQVLEISLGQLHSCALVRDGDIYCWGYDGLGQVGNGVDTSYIKTEPVRVDGPSGARQIDAGGWHTCATYDDGTMRCWGAGEHGRLGIGAAREQNEASPTLVADLSLSKD